MIGIVRSREEEEGVMEVGLRGDLEVEPEEGVSSEGQTAQEEVRVDLQLALEASGRGGEGRGGGAEEGEAHEEFPFCERE